MFIRGLVFLVFLFFVVAANAQWLQSFTVYSPEVKDSFLIQLRLPKGYTAGQPYHHVYAADGTLKMGNYILGKDSSWRATVAENCIVITIGHFGDWHSKRRRDFIPSDAGGYSDPQFGKARSFYLFLKNTLIPQIDKRFVKRRQRTFIGHSFSGLFCLYTLFQDDILFDRHFAISPSVWANDRELLTIEKNFFASGKKLKASVMMQAGGLEIFNKVLSSSNELHQQLGSRKYPQLKMDYSLVNNANHYSIIKPAIDKIFKAL